MSDDFNDAELAALDSDVQNVGVFFRLGTEPPVRLWLGFGDIQPGVNVLDADGAVYQGFGEIKNIPVYKQLLNGAAERVSFDMSGVSGKVLQLAAVSTDTVIGKSVDIGFMLFDSNWSSLGPVHWYANYTAGPLSMRQQINKDPQASPTRVLSLSAGSTFTSRRRPGFSYLTNTDQQARNPGDLFCSLAAQYAIPFNIAWPIYS